MPGEAESDNYEKPVSILIITWKRPDETKELLRRIETHKGNIYIYNDGKKEGWSEEENEDHQACREVIAEFNKKKTNVIGVMPESENQGCKRAVEKAIDWFYSREEEGVVLEDDVMPLEGFLDFMGVFLERYKNDEGVFAICGDNRLHGKDLGQGMAYLSKYFLCWGWGSWREKWRWYRQLDIDQLIKSRQEWIEPEQLYLRRKYMEVKENNLDTWDYVLQMGLLLTKTTVITAGTRLTENIGFNEKANHLLGYGHPDRWMKNRFTVGRPGVNWRDVVVQDEICRKADKYYFDSNLRKFCLSHKRGWVRILESLARKARMLSGG